MVARLLLSDIFSDDVHPYWSVHKMVRIGQIFCRCHRFVRCLVSVIKMITYVIDEELFEI